MTVARGCAVLLVAMASACGDDAPGLDAPGPELFVAVTFNTGTNAGMGHDSLPDDGYGTVEADYSDLYYGDGMAWNLAIEAARRFFATVDADVVAFQEIFHTEGCSAVPAPARTGFYCADFNPGDPTVASYVLGEGFQVACHLGKHDKCAAVRKTFGTFRDCDSDFCLEGLVGGVVSGCGSGSRVGRAVIERTDGTTMTLVSVHGTSGVSDDDEDCRVRQVEQVFVDLGDAQPAANGQTNLVLGDFNTDPDRMAGFDVSALRWNDFVGPDRDFDFVTEVGPGAPASYLGGLFQIDHVVSDQLGGNCWIAGITEGHADVMDSLYFDHKPIVCSVGLEDR